jgi:predicted metalloprotease
VRTLVLAVALVFGIACVVGSPPREPGPTAQPPTSATPPPPEPDEFQGDIEAAATVAREYWQAQFAASGERFQPIRRIIPYTHDGDVVCSGEPLGRNNAAYCVAEDVIAYDVNWARRAFTQLGDAFVYYLLGHEYAHGIQVRLGIEHELSIQQELQADCFAGAYIGDSVRAGRLQLEDGDLDELRAGLVAVADDPGQPWFAEGAHGTAEQRTGAFFGGYERSLAACDVG